MTTKKTKGRTPDYKIKLMNKETGEINPHIGAGWNNENGSISIVLSLGIVLKNDPDMVITLFPFD